MKEEAQEQALTTKERILAIKEKNIAAKQNEEPVVEKAIAAEIIIEEPAVEEAVAAEPVVKKIAAVKSFQVS